MAEKEKKQTPQNRDKAGRFLPGNSGNPGGRPPRPANLQKYAKEAPERLRAIADAPGTPVKVKADIEKWFFEVVYGKATQAVDIEGELKNSGVTTVKFEGALEEWSK